MHPALQGGEHVRHGWEEVVVVCVGTRCEEEEKGGRVEKMGWCRNALQDYQENGAGTTSLLDSSRD